MAQRDHEQILVVEDDPGMRRAVSRVLTGRYRTEAVSSVAEAREKLATGAFDLALVDLQLGESDGYSLCKWVRGNQPDTEVILMTGSVTEADEKLYRSLEEDAFYFLFKPFDRRVLLALVERCLRLQRERRSKEEYAQALSEDLERARRFQRSLLPRGPLVLHGWHVEGRFLPCDALGGDLYFALDDHAGGVAVAIADVVGHGISAAMYAGMLRSTLDAVRRRDPEPDPVARELLAAVDFFEGRRYSTLAYARLLAGGAVRYFNAGHPPALLVRSGGDSEELGATGPILSRSLPFPTRRVEERQLKAGDRVLFYTDGLFEARDPKDEELGRESVHEAFRAASGLPPKEALDALLVCLESHAKGRPLNDDVTLMLVERVG